MPSYLNLSSEQAEQEILALNKRYQGYLEQKLNLNMTRGKTLS